jgi:hypothetical protein
MGNSPALPADQASTTTAESAFAIKGIFWRKAATFQTILPKRRHV